MGPADKEDKTTREGTARSNSEGGGQEILPVGADEVAVRVCGYRGEEGRWGTTEL